MSEITIWGSAILIFLAVQFIILKFEILTIKDKINNLELNKNKEEYKRFQELEEELSSILKKSNLPKGCYYFVMEKEE